MLPCGCCHLPRTGQLSTTAPKVLQDSFSNCCRARKALPRVIFLSCWVGFSLAHPGGCVSKCSSAEQMGNKEITQGFTSPGDCEVLGHLLVARGPQGFVVVLRHSCQRDGEPGVCFLGFCSPAPERGPSPDSACEETCSECKGEFLQKQSAPSLTRCTPTPGTAGPRPRFLLGAIAAARSRSRALKDAGRQQANKSRFACCKSKP